MGGSYGARGKQSGARYCAGDVAAERRDRAQRLRSLGQGRSRGVLSFFASDVIFYPFPQWVEAGEYRGHEGVRNVFAVWTENFDEFAIEVHELRDAGGRVVALYEQSGRIKDSGVPVRQRVGGVFWDFRRGE